MSRKILVRMGQERTDSATNRYFHMQFISECHIASEIDVLRHGPITKSRHRSKVRFLKVRVPVFSILLHTSIVSRISTQVMCASGTNSRTIKSY